MNLNENGLSYIFLTICLKLFAISDDSRYQVMNIEVIGRLKWYVRH